MCTVTYLPTEDGYILTSNRDEWPGRPTSKPTLHNGQNRLKLLYPADGIAGGSWIAVSNTGATACMLNGAFELHVRNSPYRRSRGLVLLDAFEYERFEDFVQQYNFNQIEPFTLLFLIGGQLQELRWEGTQTHYRLPEPNKPHIWASATLYTPEYIAKRTIWFEEWLLSHPVYEPQSIMEFHHTGGEGDKYNDIIMNREGMVQTVSITCVVRRNHYLDMFYEDLLTGDVVKEGVKVI
ncbi:NRDE family protein [soil metagenome]